jgi:hypothetical protein
MSVAMLPAPRPRSWGPVVLLAVGLTAAGVLAGIAALLAGGWVLYPSTRLIGPPTVNWNPIRLTVNAEYLTTDPIDKVVSWYTNRPGRCDTIPFATDTVCGAAQFKVGGVYFGRSTLIRAAPYATTRILLNLEISYSP